MNRHASEHLALPPNQSYWAMLDALVLANRRADSKQLGYLFEAVLPVPIEQVQAVYAKVGAAPQRYIACGMLRSALEQELAAHPEKLLSIAPSAIPEFILTQLGEADAANVSAASLNLLVNDFEPLAVKRLRRRWLGHTAAAAIFLTILLVVGLERRTALAHQSVQRVHQAKANLFQQVLKSSGSVGQPLEIQLLAELRTLRQTRKQPMQWLVETDSTIALAALLRSWPGEVHMQTESISITPATITIRGMAPTSADVQKLADALQNVGADGNSGERPGPEIAWAGWRVQQPQINATRDAVQATLQLKSVKEQPSR